MKIIMMIGLPGCGKSTETNNIMRSGDYRIVSPDLIRKELYGDISILGNSGEVFALVEQRLREAVAEDVDVIYDATNTRYRKNTIAEFLGYGENCHSVEAIFLDTPFEVCMSRNLARRDRQEPVPEAVMLRMQSQLQSKLPDLDEGFSKLTIIRTADDGTVTRTVFNNTPCRG